MGVLGFSLCFLGVFFWGGVRQRIKPESEVLELRLKIIHPQSSHCGLAVMNPTSIHEDMSSIPGFTQWVKDLVLP